MGTMGRAIYAIGVWIRETGQAIDHLGCRLQGNYHSKEQCDVNSIKIGTRTNVQDNAVIHATKFNSSGPVLPTIIGSNVSVGHSAVLRGCIVEDYSLIGIGAILLDGVIVETHSAVAAGALVHKNTRIPSGEVWGGNPAKFIRQLTQVDKASILQSPISYSKIAKLHAVEKALIHLSQDPSQDNYWSKKLTGWVYSLGKASVISLITFVVKARIEESRTLEKEEKLKEWLQDQKDIIGAVADAVDVLEKKVTTLSDVVDVLQKNVTKLEGTQNENEKRVTVLEKKIEMKEDEEKKGFWGWLGGFFH